MQSYSITSVLLFEVRRRLSLLGQSFVGLLSVGQSVISKRQSFRDEEPSFADSSNHSQIGRSRFQGHLARAANFPAATKYYITTTTKQKGRERERDVAWNNQKEGIAREGIGKEGERKCSDKGIQTTHRRCHEESIVPLIEY